MKEQIDQTEELARDIYNCALIFGKTKENDKNDSD